MSSPKPLSGIRVLELARILAGPWIGQTLADLGADRILTLNVAESEAYLAAEVARWEALLKR